MPGGIGAATNKKALKEARIQAERQLMAASDKKGIRSSGSIYGDKEKRIRELEEELETVRGSTWYKISEWVSWSAEKVRKKQFNLWIFLPWKPRKLTLSPHHHPTLTGSTSRCDSLQHSGQHGTGGRWGGIPGFWCSDRGGQGHGLRRLVSCS